MDDEIDRRSKTYKDLAKIAPSTRDLLGETIDGEHFQYKREPRCKVCTSPEDVKDLIDTLLVFPKTYQETLEMATPLMDAKGLDPKKRPSYSSIRSHQKNHLPFDKLAVREIVERRAQERGKKILNGKGRLLTAEAFYEVTVQKTWDDLTAGRLKPSLQEGMIALNHLQALEREAEGGVSLIGMMAQLNVIIGAVREVVPPSMWIEIQQRIEQAEARQISSTMDVIELDSQELNPEDFLDEE